MVCVLLALDLYMRERFVLSTWESLGIEHVTVNTFGCIYQGGGEGEACCNVTWGGGGTGGGGGGAVKVNVHSVTS